jgi:hypothetical protein
VSGRELRLLDQQAPLWNFTLTWEKLRDNFDLRGPISGGVGVSLQELRTILAFYLKQQSSFATWLYSDPTDNYTTGQFIATADGGTSSFFFLRTLAGTAGSFSETLYTQQINSLVPMKVYLNGQLTVGSYSISGNGLTFSSPPTSGTVITADFGYYFMCRFQEGLPLENFAYRLWSLKELKFTSVLP